MSQALRDRLERAKSSLQEFADELDAKAAGPNAEDQQQLMVRVDEIKMLSDQLKAMNLTHSALSDTSTFLSELSAAPHGAVKSPDEVERTPDGRIAFPTGKTLGEVYTESAEYASLGTYIKGKGEGSHVSEHVKNFRTLPFQVDQKALVTGTSATSAGAAVFNDRHQPITDLVGDRMLRVRDLVTNGTTTSDAIDYVRVTGRTNNADFHAETTNVTSSAIKAESSVEFEVVTTNVKQIAHWIPITRRAAADAGQVRTYIDAFLRYGIAEKLDTQMLVGDGNGQNFTGILNSSGIQTQDATTGAGGGSALDATVQAMAKVRYTGMREASAIVLNPNDWYSDTFLLKKDTTGRYIVGDPNAGFDQMNSLWSLRVVVTPAMTEGTAIVGDFRQAILWEREGIQLLITDSHSDLFVRNVLVILAEGRWAFGVLDPQAFCKVTNI